LAIRRADLDPSLAAERIGGVEQQVQQQLPQTFVVAANARQPVVEAEGELDVAEAGLAVDELDGVRHDLRKVCRAFDPSD
jgi:hypothetical protein